MSILRLEFQYTFMFVNFLKKVTYYHLPHSKVKRVVSFFSLANIDTFAMSHFWPDLGTRSFFFQIRSLLILFPWIAIAPSLILPIFRFAHRSIALKKTRGSLSKKSAKTLDRSWNYSGSLFLKFALRSFSYWAPLLPKSRFAQEWRGIERFQRAMCPALLFTVPQEKPKCRIYFFIVHGIVRWM